MISQSRAFLLLLSAPAALLVAAPSPAAVVTVAADKVIRVDGEPFFPIMQWAQCGWRVEHQSSLGINTFVGNGCSGDTSAVFLDYCQAQGVWGVVDSGDMSVREHPALLGWVFGDEPDLDSNQVEPAQIQSEYDAIKAADPDHITFLTLTAGFYSGFDPPAWMQGSRDRYAEYGAASDVVGFDHYPIYGWCQPGWIDQIGDAHDELVDLYAPTPATYQWIECSAESGQWCELCERCASPPPSCSREEPCEGDGTWPEEVRNEVWQAIVHGATAIGYFTHAWECPAYTQLCLTPALEAELLRTNQQITTLTGPLLSPEVTGAVSAHVAGAAQVDWSAREHSGQLYLFAVNVSRQVDQVSFSVVGLSSEASVEVVDEARQLGASGDTFADSFEPLEVHIYRIDLATADAGVADATVAGDAAAADGAAGADGGQRDAGSTAEDAAAGPPDAGEAAGDRTDTVDGGAGADGCACASSAEAVSVGVLLALLCLLRSRRRPVSR